MLFSEDSTPIAIYWKNGTGIKFFLLKECLEMDIDNLLEADTQII